MLETKPIEVPQAPLDVYSAVRWSAVTSWGSQAIQLATSIVLARILAPDNFGLLAMAMIVTGFVDCVRNFGFIQVIIQRQEIGAVLLSSLFCAILAISCLMAVGMASLSPVFSWVYNDPRIGPIIVALSATFVISGLGIVPSSLLTRQMSFDRIAAVTGGKIFISSVVSILLALCGWEVWAMVWGSIAGVAVHTASLYLLCPWRPRLLFDWAEVRTVLPFAMNLTGSHIFNYVTQNADKFIIGVFLDATSLGFYAIAARLLKFSVMAVSNVLGRVLLPAYSRMQDDDARLKSAFLRVCSAIGLGICPMMLGLMAVAGPFVQVLLGSQWHPAVPLLRVLAPLAIVQAIEALARQLFVVKGRADLAFRWGVTAGTLCICSFFVGINWGILGVAISYLLTNAMLMIIGCQIAFRLVDGLALRDLYKALMPYVYCSGIMAVLVTVCQILLEWATIRPVVILPTCVALGLVSYASLIYWVRPLALDDLFRLVPKLRSSIFYRVRGGTR